MSQYSNAVIIQISGMTASENISVTLSVKKTGQTISWSTGDPTGSANSLGITVGTTSGVTVPVSSFSMTGTKASVTISADADNNSATLTLSGYLAATDGLESYYVTANFSGNTKVLYGYSNQSLQSLDNGHQTSIDW